MALLVVLVVGLVVGGGIVAVFSGGEHITVRRAAPSPTTAPPTGPPGPHGGADVRLGKACLRAVNDAEGAYSLLGALGAAARNFDVGKLDDLVRRAQALQRSLAADLQVCRAGIQLPAGSPPSS